jgi:hypothetical protein
MSLPERRYGRDGLARRIRTANQISTFFREYRRAGKSGPDPYASPSGIQALPLAASCSFSAQPVLKLVQKIHTLTDN